MTVALGSALPLDTTVTVGRVISVTDWLPDVAPPGTTRDRARDGDRVTDGDLGVELVKTKTPSLVPGCCPPTVLDPEATGRTVGAYAGDDAGHVGDLPARERGGPARALDVVDGHGIGVGGRGEDHRGAVEQWLRR